VRLVRLFIIDLLGRTAGITEPEQLTQRKSKRPIEGFVCMPLLAAFSVSDCTGNPGADQSR
ncbi:MAG: hypothetical protein ACK42H_10985, partial [Planctomycetota bacterium]